MGREASHRVIRKEQEEMKAMRWIVDRVLGLLTSVALVLAGVGVGVGVFEHDLVLVVLGVGFAGVAWLFYWLDGKESGV